MVVHVLMGHVVVQPVIQVSDDVLIEYMINNMWLDEKDVYAKYLLIHVAIILVKITPYVYRRLMDINVYVQVLFIQVHYVKLIKILVNILRVKMVFVSY